MKRYTLLHTLFLCFSMCQIYSQELNWINTIGGLERDESLDIAQDATGNIVIVGKHGGGDFDPGPNQYNLTAVQPVTPSFYYDAFVAKYDANGNLLWAKTTGSDYKDEASNVAIDALGNILVVGYIHDNIDLDPGPGIAMSNTTAINEYPYIQKFDPNGNLLWAKALNSYCDEFGGMDVAIDNNNNIIWGVQAEGFTINVSGNQENFVGQGYTDAFVLKLNSSGNILWCKQFGSASSDWLKTLTIDQNNDIIIGGQFGGDPIFDPGGVAIPMPQIQSSAWYHAYIVKLNSSGDYQWARNIEDVLIGETFSYLSNTCTQKIGVDDSNNIYGYIEGSAESSDFLFKMNANGNKQWIKKMLNIRHTQNDGFDVDVNGNIYRSYNFYSTTDANPGIGINTFNCNRQCAFNPGNGMMIHKLDNNGNFIWGRELEACVDDIFGLVISTSNKLLITGIYAAGFDFATLNGPLLSTDHSSPDIFFTSIDQVACSDLVLVIDTVSSLNCVDSAVLMVHGEGGLSPYNYSFNGGDYLNNSQSFIENPGFYTVSVKDYNGCINSTLIHFTAPTINEGFDLNANLISGEYRPGFSRSMTIDAFSDGCESVNATVKLVLDPLVHYQGSSPAVSQINGDTLIWNIGSLNYDSLHFTPIIDYLTDSTAQIGSSVCFTLIILPNSMDFDPLNNIKDYCFPIVNGYDPNDISVYPNGKCEEHYIKDTQKLTYTIRFQNTGNSEAINIRILNTISDKLDLNTLRIIGSSDYMFTQLKANREINFVFPSINLPDATSNEEGSHGYIIYEIKPQADVVQDNSIENFAKIYFDFNPEIVTNTVFNTVYTDNFETLECSKNTDEEQMVLIPNPSSSNIQFLLPEGETQGMVSIYSTSGQELFKEILKSGEIINLNNIPIGIYFLRVKTENAVYCEKFIKVI